MDPSEILYKLFLFLDVESLIQSRSGQICSKRGKSCHHDHQSCCDGLECRKDDDDVLATCKQIGYTSKCNPHVC